MTHYIFGKVEKFCLQVIHSSDACTQDIHAQSEPRIHFPGAGDPSHRISHGNPSCIDSVCINKEEFLSGKGLSSEYTVS